MFLQIITVAIANKAKATKFAKLNQVPSTVLANVQQCVWGFIALFSQEISQATLIAKCEYKKAFLYLYYFVL